MPYLLNVLRHLQTEAHGILNEWADGRYPEAYSHLLVGAVFGAVLPLLDGSLNVMLPGQPASESPGAKSFDQYLDEIFGYLRSGF
jgi:hypothetical protein